MDKKFYWLKLQKTFFTDIRMKRLRRMAGGDTFTIIYLKMLLTAIENEGVLCYDSLGGDFEDNLALDLDEDTDNVKITTRYLQQVGLLEIMEDGSRWLPEAAKAIGVETSAAARMRKMREAKAGQLCEQKRNNVTPLLRERSENVTTDIDIEIEIDKESEILAQSSESSAPEADVEALVLNDGTEWRPSEDLYQEYVRLYPGVDVKAQFAAMRAWCLNNPRKRKTRKGICRFVGSWLSGEQNTPKVKYTKAPPGHDFPERTYDMDNLMQQIRAQSAAM